MGAYESQLVSDEEVERILDTLRTQMCCLSVCAAAWLRFYIQVRKDQIKQINKEIKIQIKIRWAPPLGTTSKSEN